MKLRIKALEGERIVELDPAGTPLVAGRGEQVALRLPDPAKNLSREHVSFRQVGGLVTLAVLSKVLGVLTSRGAVPAGGRADLGPGDTVEIGPYTITIEASPDPAAMAPGAVGLPAWTGAPAFPGQVAAPQAAPLGEFVVPPLTPAAQGGFSQGGAASTAGAADGPLNVIGPAAPADVLAGARAVDDFLGGDQPPAVPAAVVPPLVVEMRREPEHAANPPWAAPPPTSVVQAPPAAPHVASDIAAILQQIQLPGSVAPAAPAAVVPEIAQGPAAAVDPAAQVYPAQMPIPVPEEERTVRQAPRPALHFDAAAFARGLGIAMPESLSSEDWVRIGSTLRQLADAMNQLMGDRAALKGELRALNKTQLYLSENNPYKVGLSLDELLRHLLWGDSADGAFMSADHAVREAIDDLRAHNLAIIAASRASVEGTVREFSPEQLRRHLATSRAARLVAIMEHGQLWRSYVDYYDLKSSQMADWLEALFEKHFVAAYSREADRLSQAHIPLP